MITKQTYLELLPFRDGPVKNEDGPTPMIRHLVNQGFVAPCGHMIAPELSVVETSWRLTPKGEIAVKDFELEQSSRLEHVRKEKAEKKHQRMDQYLAAIAAALVTFVLGLLAEYLFDVVGAIVMALH